MYKKTEDKAKITAYHTAFKAYYLDKNGASPSNDAALKTTAETAKTEMLKLKEPKADAKIVEDWVAAEFAYVKIADETFNHDLDASGDGSWELTKCQELL